MRKRISAFFSVLAAIVLLTVPASAASSGSTLKIICADAGQVIFTPPGSTQYAYRYGPAILIDGDRIDIWASAPPLVSNGVRYGNDSIEYIRSTDGGKTWTEWKTVLYPTLNSEDQWSTCDPGAFKYGDYYYVGYTGSPEFRTNPDKLITCLLQEPKIRKDRMRNGTATAGAAILTPLRGTAVTAWAAQCLPSP